METKRSAIMTVTLGAAICISLQHECTRCPIFTQNLSYFLGEWKVEPTANNQLDVIDRNIIPDSSVIPFALCFLENCGFTL